jgi:hypothetical protein
MELAESGQFPTPTKAHIHVGEEDWQSHPDAVVRFGKATGIPVTIVAKRGHTLGKEYVGHVLDAHRTTVSLVRTLARIPRR